MMKKKKKAKKERYSVIISCETDARKKSYAFSVRRRSVLAGAAALAVVVIACSAVALVYGFKAAFFSAKTQDLKNVVDNQAATIDTYKDELDSLQDGTAALGDE